MHKTNRMLSIIQISMGEVFSSICKQVANCKQSKQIVDYDTEKNTINYNS